MDSFLESFLDGPQLAERIFFPRRISPDDLSEHPHVRPITLKIAPEVTIGGIFLKNGPQFPTVVLFHGNGEVAADYLFQAEDYMDCGINLVIPDFRGYGWSSGSPTFLNLINDSQPILDKISALLGNHHFSGPLCLMGRSLGCVPALKLASKHIFRVRGLILESGFADSYRLFTDLFQLDLNHIPPEQFHPWNNLTFIPEISSPSLVIHGTKDNIVPFAQGQQIFQNIPATTLKQFVPIEGARHNDIHYFKETYFGAIREFVYSHL